MQAERHRDVGAHRPERFRGGVGSERKIAVQVLQRTIADLGGGQGEEAGQQEQGEGGHGRETAGNDAGDNRRKRQSGRSCNFPASGLFYHHYEAPLDQAGARSRARSQRR